VNSCWLVKGRLTSCGGGPDRCTWWEGTSWSLSPARIECYKEPLRGKQSLILLRSSSGEQGHYVRQGQVLGALLLLTRPLSPDGGAQAMH
jgi:hypothetical protein